MNIEEYKDEIKKYKEVYIFGAGNVGRIIYNLNSDHETKVKAFVVTNIQQNKSEYLGIPVFQVDSDSLNHHMPVLIAVMEYGERQVHDLLEKMGFETIVDTPVGILDYDPWEYKRARSPVIEVTVRIGCTVNCRYCPQKLLSQRYYTDDRNRRSIMSVDDFKKYLDLCPSNTIVDFSGFAEPFLVNESLEMMEYTYRSGHEMTLFTTLRGLKPEDAERVVQMPFRYVCLHTPDKDGYAQIPMTDEYFETLNTFIEATKNDGKPFIDSANCQSDAHPDILKRTSGKLKIYCEMSDRAGNLDENDASLAHVRTEGPIYCSRAFALNHNILLPDGSLALCCNDFGLDNIIGNLDEKSYEEIMNGEILRDIKRAMHIEIDRDMICRKCMFACNVEKREKYKYG